VVTDDLDVSYQNADLGFNVGARLTAVVPFLEARHARFHAPTVGVLAPWRPTHRYRTGGGAEGIPTELPMLVAGFAFRRDA
jgi:hypothetical protein